MICGLKLGLNLAIGFDLVDWQYLVVVVGALEIVDAIDLLDWQHSLGSGYCPKWCVRPEGPRN